MRVIDADGHVEESQATFSDTYLDPGFRSQRPHPVGREGLVYWMIDEQLFPRRVGRGCHNLGTPVSIDGKPARHSIGKTDSPESMELSDLKARLKSMDEEDIAIQVIYPTLFLAYPLTVNAAFATALTSAYNRFMGDRLSGQERLRWVAVVNLDDMSAAAKQVHEAKRLGASGVMILGTAGDRLLDDESLYPFYDAVAEEKLPLAVHVGWSCPPLSNLYTHIYPSGVIPFCAPVLMGFASFISGGLLDRYPDLRVAFLEAGSLWIHFMLDRLEHRYKNSLAKILPQLKPKSARAPIEYVRRGNLYFSAEVEDSLLPQVIDLVGEGQILFGSDMPHGDRERFAGRLLQERKDLSDASKRSILETNPLRFYGLS
jgi:uncharacterized protein